jgi:hypothetical protein
MFFFEKKNQKTFATWCTWPGWLIHTRARVFCFFSSEKKSLFCCIDYPRLTALRIDMRKQQLLIAAVGVPIE